MRTAAARARGVALFKSAARRPARSRAHLGPTARSRPSRPHAAPFHISPTQATLARIMPVKGGTKCIKYLLFGFNFIFWVSECDRRARLSGATCPPRAFCPRSGLRAAALPARGRLLAGRRGRCGRQLTPRPEPRRAGRAGWSGARPKRGGRPTRGPDELRVGLVSAPTPSPSECRRKNQSSPLLGTQGPGREGLWRTVRLVTRAGSPECPGPRGGEGCGREKGLMSRRGRSAKSCWARLRERGRDAPTAGVGVPGPHP